MIIRSTGYVIVSVLVMGNKKTRKHPMIAKDQPVGFAFIR